jgi:hypothetical protein
MILQDIFVIVSENSSNSFRRKRTMRIAAFLNTNSDSSVGSGNTFRTVVNARDARRSAMAQEKIEDQDDG